jgi:serine/threonine-protein kinase RsbW
MNGLRAGGRLAVPRALDQAAAARQRLRDDLRRHGIEPGLVSDAELVLSEIITNALLHGKPLRDGSIGIEWSTAGSGIRVAVTDGGSPARLRAFDVPNFAATGRGLGIVAQLAREWGVELHHPGVTVWAVVGGE